MNRPRVSPLGVGYRRWQWEVEKLLMGLGIPMAEIDDLPLENAFFQGASPEEFYRGIADRRQNAGPGSPRSS